MMMLKMKNEKKTILITVKVVLQKTVLTGRIDGRRGRDTLPIFVLFFFTVLHN